jgi:alpha-glucuronidase
MRITATALGLAALLLASPARAETGYDLWLRYTPIEAGSLRDSYRAHATEVVVAGESPTIDALRAELRAGLGGMLGAPVSFAPRPTRAGAILVGTPSTSPTIAALGWGRELEALGPEGFLIRTTRLNGRPATVVAASTDRGALYGAFRLLRLLQTRQSVDSLRISDHPRIALRLLDHWDNLDGSVERGYAGESIWKWDELPGRVDPRLRDYARACASVGINGVVLNNVNADPRILRADYLAKVAALAAALRPYGIRVYLSANFSAPLPPSATPEKMKKWGGIGDLPTADPLDPRVRSWWKAKVDGIYRAVPDFGGFLVKANSEGMPGPSDYGRSHADGANMLAEALAPHHGVVMWRAFVYPANADPDRAKRAYDEFLPLDGRFAANVLVQPKNGPLDFQPHEPFHPLFGAMPKTPLMMELEVTQEYLGHADHLVYLAPMWEEVLRSDTYERGPGSTVAKVVDGTLEGHSLTGIAGVANVGSDENWTGHPFAQANWYAFGRLAWNPELTSASIADEWARMTWGNDPRLLATVTRMMMGSWPAAVDYMTPLGLSYTIEGGDHFDPAPATRQGSFWTADRTGLGYDRTMKGSGYVAQYHSPLRERLDDPRTTPLSDLLWFHRVPWGDRLTTGRTMWDELAYRYYRGVSYVDSMASEWATLRDRVDPQRFRVVSEKLRTQQAHARLWRDTNVRYFQCWSGKPIPPEALALASPGERAPAPAPGPVAGKCGG